MKSFKRGKSLSLMKQMLSQKERQDLEGSQLNKFKVNGFILDTSYVTQPLKQLLDELLRINLHNIQQDQEETFEKEQNYLKILNNAEALGVLWQNLFGHKDIPQQNEELVKFLKDGIINSERDIKRENGQDHIDMKINQAIEQHKKCANNIIKKLQKIQSRMEQEKVDYFDLIGFKKIILQAQRKLFIQSIAAIKQLNNQQKQYKHSYSGQVQVYFQQCYPKLIMNAKILKKIIGEKSYFEKVKKMPKLDCLQKNNHQNTIVSCHYCRKMLPPSENFKQCRVILREDNLKPTLMTDPKMYYKLFYDPLNHYKIQERATNQETAHPYTTYYHMLYNKKNKIIPVCNRVYCQQCFERLVIYQNQKLMKKIGEKKELSKQEEDYVCGFCLGSCTCERCQEMDFIIKATAYYIRLGGNIEDLSEQFIFPRFKNVQIQNKQVKSIGKYSKKIMKDTVKYKRSIHQALQKLYKKKILKPLHNLEQIQESISRPRKIQKGSKKSYKKYYSQKYQNISSKTIKREASNIQNELQQTTSGNCYEQPFENHSKFHEDMFSQPKQKIEQPFHSLQISKSEIDQIYQQSISFPQKILL